MKNLVGSFRVSATIIDELYTAGITILTHTQDLKSEVTTHLSGQLLTPDGKTKAITCTRAWTYWVVQCKVPLHVAEKIYDTDLGREFIRADGDATCPHPGRVARIDPHVLMEYCSKSGRASLTRGQQADLMEMGVIPSDRFVTLYHIDTQEALNLFIQILRNYGLVGKPEDGIQDA